MTIQRLNRKLSKALSVFEGKDIRGAAILGCVRASKELSNAIAGCQTAQELLGLANLVEAQGALKVMTNLGFEGSLDEVEGIFELALSGEDRKELGAVYTPRIIRDYLITQSLLLRNSSSSELPRLLDPSCGSGGFLLSAADYLHKKLHLPTNQIWSKHIFGIDVSEVAVKNANVIAELHIALHGGNPGNAKLNIIVRDTLLTPASTLLESLGVYEGFDVVCTNPPYVKLQTLDERYRVELANAYASFASGSFSLALLFLIQGIELLNKEGVVGYITQNNIPTSLAAKPIRQWLQSRELLRRYIDFGHQQIFEDASAYTCLLFAGKRSEREFQYASMSEKPRESTLNALAFDKLKHVSLDSEKWRLGYSKHLDHIKHIEQCGEPLGALAYIRVGFATLKDSVFLVRSEYNENHAQNFERELLRPAIKISELSSEEDLKKNRLWIIFPYRKVNGRYVVIPEDEMTQRFPFTYHHLLKNRSILAQRDKGKNAYMAWYEWGRTQGRDAEGPKLLTKTFSSKPMFFLDNSDSLFCNGYAIKPKNEFHLSGQEQIFLLQAILNSEVMHYYAKLTSFQIEGDYQCYQKNFIERFGIPELTPSFAKAMKSIATADLSQFLAEEIYKIPYGLIKEVTCKDLGGYVGAPLVTHH